MGTGKRSLMGFQLEDETIEWDRPKGFFIIPLIPIAKAIKWFLKTFLKKK